MESVNSEDLMNVCRLCLGTDNLMSIFDDRIKIPENMMDVIQITTGVTISPSDEVSQKLCYKCVNITIRMFKFRTSSMVNNLELKEKASSRKNKLKVHKSIQLLCSRYPEIILPASITEINISPKVSIDKKEVENWKREYRWKKKFEKMMKRNLAQKDNEEVKDVEKDITPHIITSLEKIPDNQANNSVVEMEVVESNDLPPVLEPMIPVRENESPTSGPSSANNIPHEDLTRVATDEQETIENKGKRKLDISSDKQEVKKMKTNLENHETESSGNSLLDLKYVNECIYLCDICNNILYNVKDLKRHKNKHMRCTLCKKSFRSLRETEEHSENNCPIKHMMTNLPNIRLQRCDQSDEIRKQYPSAFGIITEEVLDIKPNVPVPEETKVQTDDISLISDEEDAALASNDNPEYICKVINSNPDIVDLSVEKSTRSGQEKREKVNNSNSKPDLEITGDNVLNLNLDDEEISLVRNILKRTNKNIRESSMQTDIPNNCDIVASLNKEKLFEMKNLREYLNYYKIPVNVSYATQYAAKYGTDPSLLSKYQNYDWSVMKTKRKPLASASNDKVKVIENAPIKVTNEESKSASPTYTIPPLYLIKTQSQTPSQAVYTVAVQNAQKNSAQLNTTDSAKQTLCAPQNKKNGAATSSESNCANIQNNRNNANTQKSTNNGNIQKNIKTKINSDVRNNTNAKNVVSGNVINRAPPTVTKSNGQIQVDPRKNDNATSLTIFQNTAPTLNATSTNFPRKEVQIGLSSVRHNKVFPGTTQNTTNVMNGTTSGLTFSIPQTIVNNAFLRTNNSFSNGRTNAVLPMQQFGVNNNTVVSPATFSNVQISGANFVTPFSSANSMTLPTVAVNSGISNATQNSIRIRDRHNSYLSFPRITNTNVNGKISQTSMSNLIYVPTVNNQSRASTYIPPSVTQPNNIVTLPRPKNSTIPSTSFSIQMPPPPPPPVVSQQSTKFSQRTDASVNGTKTMNQNIGQSTSSTTSTSHNGNNFVPLIRVRNVAELR